MAEKKQASANKEASADMGPAASLDAKEPVPETPRATKPCSRVQTGAKTKKAAAPELAANEAAGLSPALAALVLSPRVTVRRPGAPDPAGKCVVYWMQRAQRGVDNHAVNLAVAVANELKLPLVVYFAGISNFPHANLRHYHFLQQGLPDIEEDLGARNIAFVTRYHPRESHAKLLADAEAAIVIGDENPMRVPESWRVELAKKISIPFWTVDTECIVPTRLITTKQYGAYTIRPRLYKLLPEYLVPYENPKADHAWHRPKGFEADDARGDMTAGWEDFDRSVGPVQYWQGGTHAALERLKLFTGRILKEYEETRNKPEMDGTSCLSPWLHYGHIGAQTIALAVADAVKKDPSLKSAQDSYFNELIAWRELCINFLRFEPNYDNPKCAEDWAQKTIAEHDHDERERLYTVGQLEAAQTYDELWNAAQTQMVRHGWMHNYLRMYWAKKILEWTPDVDAAMKAAVYLNDKYFIDGRDPGGYAGIAWSMVGKFDRAWGSRPVFGKRRYMSGASTGKKFDSKRYIEEMAVLPR